MRNRGFTLIDLMIALAVAAILLTAGIPALGGFIAAQRIAGTSNLLVTDLNFARMRAISGYHEVALCPSTDGRYCSGGNRWESGWIVFIKRGDEWNPDTAADILRVSEPRAAVQISSTRPHSRFLPDGRAAGFPFTLTTCDPARPDRTRDVIVSNTGRVRGQKQPLASCDELDS